MIRAVFFDLFFTLIYPRYGEMGNEYDVLNISAEDWERYAENEELYNERALGKVRTEEKIIERITAGMPFKVSGAQKKLLLERRSERMRDAFDGTANEVIDAVAGLRKRGLKLCLISNADVIDRKYWDSSELAGYFDGAIFSCDVGMLKPDAGIYELAMRRMGTIPEESLFVGDGGSDELKGARRAGMRTAFSECLEKKAPEKAKEILGYADFRITRFSQLAQCVKMLGLPD